jgi:hypothetical protein
MTNRSNGSVAARVKCATLLDSSSTAGTCSPAGPCTVGRAGKMPVTLCCGGSLLDWAETINCPVNGVVELDIPPCPA